MARKINAVSPNESRLNGYFADPERRNTSNFRGISYEDERRADANEIYESGTKWVNEQLQSGGGSGGGGGAQPDWNAAEGEPGHILNRPFYEDTVTLFDQTVELQEAEGMLMYTSTFPEPLEDKTYKVTYNGVPYDCTPFVTDEYTAVLGNLSAMGGPDTGEPFVIVIGGIDGVFEIVLVGLTGATSATVKIEKPGELRKIESKFAPEIPYFDLVSLGLGTVKLNTTTAKEGIGHELYKALGDGPVKIRFKHHDWLGNEQDATAIVTGVLYPGTGGNAEYTIGQVFVNGVFDRAVFVVINCMHTGYVEANAFKHYLGATGSTE